MLGLVQEYHHHIPHPRILLHHGLYETLNSAQPVLGSDDDGQHEFSHEHGGG